jgi:hypothetical protein
VSVEKFVKEDGAGGIVTLPGYAYMKCSSCHNNQWAIVINIEGLPRDEGPFHHRPPAVAFVCMSCGQGLTANGTLQ